MLLSSVESKFSQEGSIRRRIKVILMTAAKLSSTQADCRDAIDMPSKNGCTSRCTRVLRRFMWLSPKCGVTTAA